MKQKFITLFKKTNLQRNLIEDFAWIAESAESNAYFGYGISEIFRSNATARDLMEISEHRMEKMITLAAKIGWNSCAGRKEQVSLLMQEFSKETAEKGYQIKDEAQTLTPIAGIPHKSVRTFRRNSPSSSRLDITA